MTPSERILERWRDTAVLEFLYEARLLSMWDYNTGMIRRREFFRALREAQES